MKRIKDTENNIRKLEVNTIKITSFENRKKKETHIASKTSVTIKNNLTYVPLESWKARSEQVFKEIIRKKTNLERNIKVQI